MSLRWPCAEQPGMPHHRTVPYVTPCTPNINKRRHQRIQMEQFLRRTRHKILARTFSNFVLICEKRRSVRRIMTKLGKIWLRGGKSDAFAALKRNREVGSFQRRLVQGARGERRGGERESLPVCSFTPTPFYSAETTRMRSHTSRKLSFGRTRNCAISCSRKNNSAWCGRSKRQGGRSKTGGGSETGKQSPTLSRAAKAAG